MSQCLADSQPQINRSPARRRCFNSRTRIPKVAILDHTANLGGGEIALLNLVRCLDAGRYRPLVVLFSDGPLRQKLHDAGIAVSIFPLDRRIVDTRKDSLGGRTLLRIWELLLAALFVWRLSSELRRRRIDIVHTNSLKSDILGGAAAKLAGIPVIWHVRDRIDSDYLPGPAVRVFRWLARWLPTCVIANSAATLRTLERQSSPDTPAAPQGPRVPPHYHVVHDGADASQVTAERKEENAAPLVGLVGRISPWKGQHIFLKAASLVRSQFPQAKFQIIGAALFSESEYEQQIRRLAESLNLTQAVEFTGFREDVPDLIANLDVLVHASTTGEPFGLVIVEAMAAGKPVVATNGGGVPEIVVDGVTGLLVPMGDDHAMAKAISRFLADRQLRIQVGRRGRQRFGEHFTIQHTADKVQQVYDSLHRREGRKLAEARLM